MKFTKKILLGLTVMGVGVVFPMYDGKKVKRPALHKPAPKKPAAKKAAAHQPIYARMANKPAAPNARPNAQQRRPAQPNRPKPAARPQQRPGKAPAVGAQRRPAMANRQVQKAAAKPAARPAHLKPAAPVRQIYQQQALKPQPAQRPIILQPRPQALRQAYPAAPVYIHPPAPAPRPVERPFLQVVEERRQQQLRLQNGENLGWLPIIYNILHGRPLALQNQAEVNNQPDQPNPAKQERAFTCNICYGNENPCRLACNHEICINCLNYMVTQAMKTKSTAELRCPSCQNRRKIELNEIKRIMDELNRRDHNLTLLDEILRDELLAANPHAKQCPTIHCKNIYVIDGCKPRTIDCGGCQAKYCSHCMHPHSDAITCQRAEALRAKDPKYADEFKNKQWKKDHTKPCPHCHVAVEKIEGCSFMTCEKCHHHFCWICLGPRTERDHMTGCPRGCKF